MRGLDKAAAEVGSAKNRVMRLYGMGRINYEDMLNACAALKMSEDTLNGIAELSEGGNTNGRGEQARSTS